MEASSAALFDCFEGPDPDVDPTAAFRWGPGGSSGFLVCEVEACRAFDSGFAANAPFVFAAVDPAPTALAASRSAWSTDTRFGTVRFWLACLRRMRAGEGTAEARFDCVV